MPDNVDKLFEIMQAKGVASDRNKFRQVFLTSGDKGYKIRKEIYDGLKADGFIENPTYEDFRRKLRLGGTPTVNKYRQQLFNSADPTKNNVSQLTKKAIGQAHRATNSVRKPVTAKIVDQKGRPTGQEFAITPAKTVEDLDREYAQETTHNWENQLQRENEDADNDAAKISDMFKSFIGSRDEVGSFFQNLNRGGGIAGVPHSVTTNNGLIENEKARQLIAAGNYNRERKRLLQLEQDTRNGAWLDDHSFFRGMLDAAKDMNNWTGNAQRLIDTGALLSTRQDLEKGKHTEAGDLLMQAAVKNADAQSQYGDNQGWMYTGGIITTNMIPFFTQITSAGFSGTMSQGIGKVVQGVASGVAKGTMNKAMQYASPHVANWIGKFTGLTTKAFGKAIQYGLVGAAQANTVGLGNVANDVMSRYTGQVYQDKDGSYKFGTFDSDGNLVHEGGEDFLTSLVKGEAAQTIEFATELAGGGIDAVGGALKKFITKGGKKIIKKYNMENVSKVIDFMLNNKLSKNVRYLKAGADRTLGKVEVSSIVGESLEEELGIIANSLFTGDNKISDLWDGKQQSQIWGGMLLSIGLMKGMAMPFHAYYAKQYYSYKHKLDKADVNLSQLLGKEKWDELRNEIDGTTNMDMPNMYLKVSGDVALGKNRSAVIEYLGNLIKMRGYDIGNMLAAKKAINDKGKDVKVKNMEKNQAYMQGREATGYDTHEIQLDQLDKQKSLAQLLGITEQQVASMSDEELESLTGKNDKLDRAIYEYQLSDIRYEGVLDNAQDKVDLEVQKAAQAVDLYTDKNRGTIRNATIQGTNGENDYGVYIVNGNLATHDDGSINISGSDQMIIYYDPTTGKLEHADATRFAAVGEEVPADDVKAQAVADAKEKAIKEIAGIIDGTVEVGSQFQVTGSDGLSHIYEVLADYGDGTAAISIDGNVVENPYSIEDLQNLKDLEDQKRLEDAKAERAQMEAERGTTGTEQNQNAEVNAAPEIDYSELVDDDGKVKPVAVEGNEDAQAFIVGEHVNKKKYKVVYLNEDGTISKPLFVDKKKVTELGEMSVDEFKQTLPSMIEVNRGEIEDNRGEIEGESAAIEGKENEAENGGENATAETPETDKEENAEESPAMTLEDGTVVPMLEDGNPDFSKLTAQQTAELYDEQFGEDADGVISGWVNDAKKALDKATNMTVKGKNFAEQKAAKAEKDKAIADAQAQYDSAVAIRDAYKERLIAKEEATPEGRKNLIDKARRKYDRLKGAVKDNAEALKKLYDDTVGSVLHRLYDGTGIDVTDDVPLTAEEYVASHITPFSLNYEGNENSKGVKQETGLSREDFAKTRLLAKDGKGTTIDNMVDKLWNDRPSNLDGLDTQDIRAALLNLIMSGKSATDFKNYVQDMRINEAEKVLEEQKRAEDNAKYQEEQKAAENEQLSNVSNDLSNVSNDLSNVSNQSKGVNNIENNNTNSKNGVNIEENENKNASADSEAEVAPSDEEKFPDKLRETSQEGTTEVPEDATDEKPLGEQREKAPFSAKGNDDEETPEERAANIEKNKVDDTDVVDAIIGKKLRKSLARIAKMMGANIQYQYTDKKNNGWYDDKTKTIYLALDSSITEGVQFIFGHEMTHEIKDKNPAAFEELKNVIKSTMGEKAFSAETDKMQLRYKKGGANYWNDRNAIEEEVVADQLGGWLRDLNYAHTLALKMSHPLLAKIHEIINRIRMAFYGTEYTDTAKEIMRSIEQAYVKTANGTFESSATGERFSLKDEEKIKRIEKLRESKPIEITGNEYQGKYELNRESAQRYLLDNLRGDYTIKDTGEVVSLAKKGAKKVTAHSMGNEAHLKSIAVIPQLIENSIFIEEQPAYKNDAKFDSYRYYVTGLKIGGEDYTARLTIGVKNGKSYYDHYLTHIEKGNLIDLINQSDSQDEGFKPTEGAPNTSDALSGGKDTKLLEILQTNRQENDEKVQYSLRQKPEPTKKGIGYKVFVLKNGKLYPPMVANPNGAETPVGVWLDADAAPIAGESKTGRPQVKQGGKGTQGGSGKLAYRPGWHLGVIPYALQFNRKDAEGNKTLFPANFVFAEVEYAADKDYQEEARQEGINANGKYQHSLAGLKHLPTDGYYMYRTNPNPETDPWVITGAMKVNRILTRAEQAELVKKAGREPQQIQEGDIVTDEVVNRINQEIADMPKFSLKVYHGSGADFDEFDFDHMGEGEGSQVFGWGGYVTSSKKIGRDYATRMDNDPSRANYRIQQSNGIRFKKKYPTLESFLKNDKQIAKKDIFTEQEKIDYYNEKIKMAEPYHNLYEVNIPDDKGDNYLDWDKALPSSIDKKEVVDKFIDILKNENNYKNADDEFMESVGIGILNKLEFSSTGRALYRVLSGYISPKAASKFLSSLGFTGIKYPAGTIQGGAEEGDTNYVIFKPEDMKIANHTKFSLKTKPVRFEVGKSLSEDEKKEVLSTLKDAYKVNGVPYHVEETANGKEKRVYEPTADDYVVSDITNRPLRYYITLPDGRVAHPSEVYPNISDHEVKSSAEKQGLADSEAEEMANKAISKMYDAKVDAKKALAILNAMQELQHDTRDVGYGMNNAQSYDYKTGIFSSNAAQAIDYVVRRMRRKEDVQDDVVNAVKKAVADNFGMVDNLIDGMSETKVGAADTTESKYSLKKVNDDFNKRLDELVKNPNQKDKILRLGRSSSFLKDGGIADADIELDFDKLMRKSKEGYVHEHPFDVSDVKDLPMAIANPISVFNNTNGRNDGQVILTELKKDDRNFIVAIQTENQNRRGGVVLKVNNIVTLFPKDARGVINWFNQGKATNIDKEKALHFIEALQNHSGTSITDEELKSAANVINSFETTKENGEKVDSEAPKFSLKDDKTLAGVHNITEEKLRKALKLGGLANPSLAVIDTDKTSHNNFGEISFIAPSALVDKRTGNTAGTWVTDAYTQRYPSVERQMTDKGYEKFKKWVDGLDYSSADKSEILRQAQDVLEDNGVPAWELMYLKEKGIDLKAYDSDVDYRWQEIIENHTTAKDILDAMKNDPELNDKVTKLAKSAIIMPTWSDISKQVRKQIYNETGVKVSPINPKVRAQVREIFERDYAPQLLNKDGSPRKADVKKVVEDMVKQHNETKKYNFYKSKVKASSYVNNNGLYPDYIRWQENKLDEFGTKNRIFRGYKNDGSRKYVPETLENVSKAMREEANGQTNGGEYTSFGSFIAKLADRVDSTEEMRANKDKLATNEDKEAFYNKWEGVYYDLAKFLYDDVFYGEQRLHDIVVQPDPKKYAKKEYGITLTPSFMKKLNALKDAVKNELKSGYFETKFDRPVRLNEFVAAVVPNNLGDDVRKGLEKAGLSLYDYDPNEESDRQRAFDEAVNSSDDIKFSLKQERESIVEDAKKNGTYMLAPNGKKTKLNEEQWANVRTDNFKKWFGDWENDPENASKVVDENGEPMVVYHGRSTDFNTFERRTGQRGNIGISIDVEAEGFFFSPNKDFAEEFASNAVRHRGGKANVVPCFLNIKKPLDLVADDYDKRYEDVTGWSWVVGMDRQDNLWEIMDEEGMADKLKAKGYDGAIFVEEVDDNYEPTQISYCALDANQIKSADNNNGDYSADNNDIRFSIRTYHGTGANFDAFDSSHALEGEGSESFGHGVYVTNSGKIGEDYTKKAKSKKVKSGFGFDFKINISSDVQDLLKNYIYKYLDVNKGLDAARKDLPEAKELFPDDDEIKELSEVLSKKNEDIAEQNDTAYLYDVEIPDDNGENYLKWHGALPSSLNKEKLAKDILGLIQKKEGDKEDWELESLENDINDSLYEATNGEQLYKAISLYVGDAEASKILSDNGIVGMKYRAGMIHGGAKDNDYNYVIYKDSDAKIVGNTKFSLRIDQYEHDLNQWKKDNGLSKDAERPVPPIRQTGESAVDFMNRVKEYRKEMALWKTAPTYEQHLLSDDTAQGQFNLEMQRGSVLKRIAFQDAMLAIRKAQEAIMKAVGLDRLNMAEDAYTAENRSHGKGKNEFEEYNDEFLQPLRKAYHAMKKVLGNSYDNVRVYMMAKHGLERDAHIAFKKALENDYEDANQRMAAYKAYKADMNRVMNDADFETGKIDFTTWRQKDNAIRTKYAPSFLDYRYDKMGITMDYSGLSALFDGSDFEEAAADLVKDVEDKHYDKAQDLWNATNAATKKILRDSLNAEMMSQETYEYVRGMYSHYIPLRGWNDTNADQVWDYIGGGKGAFNQALKTANGRTSVADDPIAYIENMAESGILLNNKNWVKQHLLLLAQNHPTSLLNVSKAWYVKSVDANGNEEWIPASPNITANMTSQQVKNELERFEKKMEQMEQNGDATQKREHLEITYPQTNSEEREHEVRVMKGGEEYVIYVNGDPQLAQAMNNTRAHRVREVQSGKLDRAAAWLGRKMAAAYTSLSPLFIPSNYFRDLTMTLASTAIREDGRYNYLLRKNLLTSWNLGFMLKDYQNGKLREKVRNGQATKKEQMFYDFMMNGGETGFVSSLDVEDLKKKFKNDLKDLDRWKANPKKVGHLIMDGIEMVNRVIEDSNRFAIYMTSIQYGRTIDEAVNDAKDVTLNFNRKGTGEYGWQTIRNLYLFINPAVQSLQTLGALAKHHKFKFTAVTSAWLASGMLVPLVNAAMISLFGGDDDKDKYWQFTKWDRRNNLIMWVPFTKEYVKIPLAQEFRGFYGVGDMIASKLLGGENNQESWKEYGYDLLGQVVDMLPLDPTGYDGNIAVSLMPNAIRPMFELAFNVDFTGKPLFMDSEYNKYDPNWTKAYVGTPDWLVRISRMVNSVGNDYPDVQQNAIDAFGNPRYNLNNPAVVDHVLSSYLGGAYTMGSQVLGVLTKALNDPKEIKMADIPLVSKFVSNPDDRPVSKKQGDEFWTMKENHDRAANTLSKLKKQAKVDGDYSLLEEFYGSEEYKQYKADDVKVKKYEEDKEKERAEESGEEYKAHKTTAEDIYKAHTTAKDDFEDLKLKQIYTKLNGFKTSYDLMVDMAPSQSDGYYQANKVAIDAIKAVADIKQDISDLKSDFLSDDGKDEWNAEDMKEIREKRKEMLDVLERANKIVVEQQRKKAESNKK